MLLFNNLFLPMLYADYLQQPMWATQWAPCLAYSAGLECMNSPYGGCMLIPLRGPLSAACFWAPSSRSAFYCVWFTALYLWANSPGGGSPRCHTHIAQPLRSAQSPQTCTASTAHRYKQPPTLNMEMLWKVNLNIYIRWLLKKGLGSSFDSAALLYGFPVVWVEWTVRAKL